MMIKHGKFLLILLMILLSSFGSSHAKEPVTSIQQLNNPQYTVGTDTDGPVLKITMENLPHAEILKFNELISQCFALNQGKIDAITGSELELRSAMRNGLENIRILPGYLGDPIPIAAGISERSEIPGLKEKFNAFIATIKADGTLSAMYKRWVDDNNMNMPVIDVPEKSDIHLTVATTGTVMPFSFYINSDVTGFDIELARRFAAHIGAEIEFKIYGFGSILMALKSGAVDLALSNLYVTPETKESVTFSDTIFELNCVVAVRDDGHKAKPQTQAEDPEIAAFSKKKIGVIIGASHVNIVREALPNAEVLYFNSLADIIQSLKNGKVDALALDEPVALEILHGNPDLKISEGKLKTINNAFIFPKSSGNEKNEKLYNEFNEYIRRIKSDGTTDKLLSIWTGNDNSLKVIPDYSKLPDTNGTVRLATDNEAPPFVFVKDGRLAGFDVDVVTRFCKEYGYRPYFDEMNFSGVIPSVITGKCDMGAGTLAVTPERSESVRFSEPVYSFAIVLVIRKTENAPKAVPSGSVNTGSFSAFNGKRIGVFTGSVQYDMVMKAIPGAEILYFESPANMIASLKSGKIDAIATDESITTEFERGNQDFTHLNENLGQGNTAFLLPKSPKNNPLADEVNEYIRHIKSDGTLDEMRAVWTGDDESKKIIPDYSKLPAEKGTLRIAVDNTTPVFSYVKDGKLTGYDVDIIVRFCKEKGYKPEFSMINFPAIIPAVGSGKCDIGLGGITVTQERSETVRFSEPIYSFASFLVIRKPEDAHESAEHTQSVSKKNDRIPIYKHLSDFDGKPIGMQPGVIDWENWVAENLPHSQVQYYNTYPDLASALKTRKIEGFLVDSPVLALMAAEDNSLTSVDEPVGESFGYSFVYAKTEKGKKLCDEMSEFIRKIKASGELDAVHSKWQGVDESLKIPPDYKSLPAKNGTLTYAAEGSYPPFTYYKGTKLAGIDIDLAARFCEAYGYGLDVQTMFFDAMIPAVQSGKIDFAGDFTPSDEHEEAVYYSEPYCIAYSVMACLKDENSKSQTVSSSSGTASEPDSLAGKRIGVQTGTTCAELVPERIPSAKLSYYDSLTDELTALRAGKVDAICCSLPAAVFTENADPTLVRINPPLRETYLYPVFADNEKGKKLCDEYSEFLKTLWDNGTIDKLNQKWLGPDENSRTVDDYSQFPNTNGSVKMAVDTSLVPFAYVKDNQIVGYDVDLAVMFCKAKGYSLEVENMPLTGVLASVKSGKSDFTQSLNRTPEREENTLFASTPAVKSGNVLLTIKSQFSALTDVNNLKLSDFAGKTIGVTAGSVNDKLVKDAIPDAKIVYFDAPSYMLTALAAGKIDAMSCGESAAIFMQREGHDIVFLPEYLRKTYRTAGFAKNAKGIRLCREYSEFVQTLWDNGTIASLVKKWITGDDDSLRVTEDYSNLPAPNGTLLMAVDPSVTPYDYVKDERVQGYEIDIAVMFCKAKGYGLKILTTNHNGVLGSLETGKCDFSYGMDYTDGRAESLLFSPVPNTESSNVIVVMKHKQPKISSHTSENNHKNETAHADEGPSFLEDIAASFRKTFLREDRWKLFTDGIVNTMFITVLSILFGMLVGFTAFMFCRTGSKIANLITKFSVWLIKGTPIVVLLMILYYVIFGHVNINGMWVSIIAFTLTFGTSVYRMLTFGTGAVDKGQTEAAYALGFTDLQTFFTVILPQAALHFMPSFREEVTLLIKSTSVVGYIAVQDLTKMGDIVRSRTYEAFFPLIAVAVIYFVLAGTLNIIVTVIEKRITPSERKPQDILKGIDITGRNTNYD